jgi:catechol 2,3-dioxygenase-like lactoylglutathione lyase family enzyme
VLYHMSLCVPDVPRAAEFYDWLLAPLGMRRIWNLDPDAVGYGRDRPEFWLQSPEHQPFLSITRHSHFAFACDSEDQVETVHAAGIAAGGRSVMAPAAHLDIDVDYFAAILEDPNGHMIEILKLRSSSAD